jgi:muconolactone delta-isomerase
MEFLVEFELHVPDGAAESDAAQRRAAEKAASAELYRRGHLVRLWRPAGQSLAIGLYRAGDRTELDALLGALPLSDWMRVTVTPLDPHPNDPTVLAPTFALPDPRLIPFYRLEATLGEPIDLGDTANGRRRIVPLTGGVFSGPDIKGELIPGVSADWQTVLSDGTALGDIRYTLRTDGGDLLDVRSASVRYGPVAVLARLGRGEAVEPYEYTFRGAIRIETAAPALDWATKAVFISVGGRQSGRVIYETYHVA